MKNTFIHTDVYLDYDYGPTYPPRVTGHTALIDL